MKADLDFAISYRSLHKRSGSGGGGMSLIIGMLIVLVSILIAGTLAFFVIVNINDGKYISEMRADLAEFEVEKIIIENNQKKLAEVEVKQNTIKDVQSTVATYRMVSKREIESIYKALDAGVKVTNAVYKNSTLELTCSTMSIYAPSNSADNLEAIGITAIIGYNGFRYEDAKDEKDPVNPEEVIQADPNEPKTYVFKVICQLNPIEGGAAK